MKSTLLGLVRRHAKNRGVGSEIFAKLGATYVGAYENYDHDGRHNGEFWLLGRLKSFDFGCIFDVGANIGDWSAQALAAFPNAEIHAFEIAPATYQKLKIRNLPVKLNDFGLSDAEGSATLAYYPENDGISTLEVTKIGKIHSAVPLEKKVSIRTGESYCSEFCIEEIDMLKIDTEGHENSVLSGFGKMLTEARIRVIQFEYGMANIYTKFLLSDFYDLLEKDYVIGKLYPTGIDFKEYHPQDENFRSPNFVAVRRNERDIISATKFV